MKYQGGCQGSTTWLGRASWLESRWTYQWWVWLKWPKKGWGSKGRGGTTTSEDFAESDLSIIVRFFKGRCKTSIEGEHGACMCLCISLKLLRVKSIVVEVWTSMFFVKFLQWWMPKAQLVVITMVTVSLPTWKWFLEKLKSACSK